MNTLEKCVELIEGQQKGIEGTAPWVVGEQLKELLWAEPELAGTVLKDSAAVNICSAPTGGGRRC